MLAAGDEFGVIRTVRKPHDAQWSSVMACGLCGDRDKAHGVSCLSTIDVGGVSAVMVDLRPIVASCRFRMRLQCELKHCVGFGLWQWLCCKCLQKDAGYHTCTHQLARTGYRAAGAAVVQFGIEKACSCFSSVGSASTGAKQCRSSLESPESCTAYPFLIPCLDPQAFLHMTRTMPTDLQPQLQIECRMLVYACAGTQIGTSAHAQHTRAHHSGTQDHTAPNVEYDDALASFSISCCTLSV